MRLPVGAGAGYVEENAYRILIYAMVQAVVFGAGVVLVRATPLAQTATQLMPWVILAPMTQARHAREMNERDPTRSFEI